MLVDKVKEVIFKALENCDFEDAGPKDSSEIQIETPKNRDFGDYSTNLPFSMAKPLKKNPREIAAAIAENIEIGPLVEKAEIAGAGFINLHISDTAFKEVIHSAIEAGDKWGWNNTGNGEKVQVEFVSANPTGPLSVGHGRLAAFGDALASILTACGYETSREYYVNDVGNQIKNLAASVDMRYKEAFGQAVNIEEGGYQGEYIKEYANDLKEEHGESLMEMDEAERLKLMAEYTIKRVLEEQAESLGKFGVKFDRWFREHELYDESLVETTLEELKNKDTVYENEGALWFSSTKYSDSQDRVLKKSGGIPTYFLSDIAYHKNKFDRGFGTVIDIWGADHHGYIPRMKSSMEALGLDPEKLEILIIQLVRFKQSGFLVRMSKRAGNLITLSDLADEVGTDVSRFFFLMRTKDTHLDFDIELAKDKSEANPMYYLQYAHARICSLLKKAQEQGMKPAGADMLEKLGSSQELLLMKRIADFPWEMASSGAAREPHRIISFLTDLAGAFHNFYHDHRVIDDENKELSEARLALCAAIRNVFKSGLSVLGISAPETM